MRDDNSLVRVCSVLNDHSVEYLVAGAHACALLGHVRATQDYDILVNDSDGNLFRVISAIQELFPGIKETITPNEIREAVVLKILDEIELDISLSAWSVDYREALEDHQETEIDGVKIPYLGLESLIKSKSTSREIDQWDVRILREIQHRQSSE